VVKHDIFVEGLLKVGEGAELDSLNGGLELAVTGEEDDLHLRVLKANKIEEVEARLVRHTDVADDYVDLVLPKALLGFFDAVGNMDGIIIFQEDVEGLARSVFIVHDEDGAAVLWEIPLDVSWGSRPWFRRTGEHFGWHGGTLFWCCVPPVVFWRAPYGYVLRITHDD
jgi:hypothetical protein